MATQVKHRRGTSSEIAAFTPAIGELVMDTSNNELILGDGATLGGHKVSQGIVKKSIAEIEALSGMSEGQTIYLSAGGRSGVFKWTLGDFTAEVAADTLQGVYVASDAVTTTVGCWVRDREKGHFVLEWFGAITDDSTDVRASVVGAVSLIGILGGGRLCCAGSYYISGVASIEMASNVVLDMRGTGSFRKDDTVLAAEFYDHSYFNFENCERSGIVNGSFNGVNSTSPNTDDTTGVSISVGEGCDLLVFDELTFNEGWTGILLGSNLSATNYSKRIYIGTVHSVDCEQAVVASAVKELFIGTINASRVDKYAQRGLFIQNVQDAIVNAVVTKDLVSTSVYFKAYQRAGLFPAANVTVLSIVSTDQIGSTNVACAVHTTLAGDANAGDATKHVQVGKINTEYSGAALQIIAENDDQLQNIQIGDINGSVVESVVDIRLNGKRVSNVTIGDINVDTAVSDFGINIDGGGSAFTHYIADNIVINSYRTFDRATSKDINIQDVDGVTVNYAACVRDYLAPDERYNPLAITTTNTNNSKVGVDDESGFISSGDYRLIVNGRLFGAAQTVNVDTATGDDANMGNTGNPVATIGRALSLIPAVCDADITVNIVNGAYAEAPVVRDKTFNGLANFNFNASTIDYLTMYNVHGRMSRLSFSDFVTTSNVVDNVRAEGCKGVTIDSMSTTASAGVAVSSLGSDLVVKDSSFGTGFTVCISSSQVSNILSQNNTGNGTSNGLRASLGSVIAKDGTQPTGTAANENASGGSVIR